MERTNRPRWRHPGFLLAYSVVAIVLTYIGGGPLVAMGRAHANDWIGVLVASAVAIWFIGIFELFRRYVEGERATEFGARRAIPELGGGILIGFLLFSAIVGVIAAFGGYRVIGYHGAQVLIPALAISILSGFTEEIVMRGYFFRLTEKWLGSWTALILSAAVFGALHLGNKHATLLAGVAITLEAGIMLAAIFMITRRLWAVIGLHAAWNFAQGGIYGIAVSGNPMEGVLRADIRGSDWLTGGAFGAEASLPAIIVATAFGLLMLYVAWRRGQFMPPDWQRQSADQSPVVPAEQA